jgi:cell division protein FtsB
MPTASAPPRIRRGLAERIVRGIALIFLSLFLFYLKLLTAILRFGIEAVRRSWAKG